MDNSKCRASRTMETATRHQIAANIFPHALPAVEAWDEFPWHSNRSGGFYTGQENSSQALAIDAFGFLKMVSQPERNCVLNALGRRWGWSEDNDWKISLEWMDPSNSLNEPRRSQIDVLAESSRNLLLLECKFTEKDAGPCSMPNPKRRQCSGNYELTADRSERCVLTTKGVRYWEFIPDVFHLSADVDHLPCPFAGPWYQWMRNLVLSRVTSNKTGRNGGFALIYADAPGLGVPRMLATQDWTKFCASLRRPSDLKAISYQEFLANSITELQLHGFDLDHWKELNAWICGKISRVAAS